MDPKDRVRRQFQIADRIVKIMSGLLMLVFLAWIIYETFFH